MLTMAAVRLGLLTMLLALGCGSSRWHAVTAGPPPIYVYEAPIERYAPGDTGFWVVTAREPSPAGRTRVGALLPDPGDVTADGFVAWLDADGAAALRARPEIAAVVPLQPADRIGPLPAANRVPVRIDVGAQRDAVLAWLAERGARATAVGARTIDADVAPALAREVARLGPVRWIEHRGP